MSFLVLDPTEQPAPPAPQIDATTKRVRLDSLRGVRVGLLANGKTNAGTLLDAVGELLEHEYGARVVVREDKGNASRPAPPAVLDRFDGQVDLVITAIGD
jgi:hypothetical protein